MCRWQSPGTCVPTLLPQNKKTILYSILYSTCSRTDWLHIYKVLLLLILDVQRHIRSCICSGGEGERHDVKDVSGHLRCWAHAFIWDLFHTLFWKPDQIEHSKPYLPRSIERNDSVFMQRSAIKANKQNQEFQNTPCFHFHLTWVWSSPNLGTWNYEVPYRTFLYQSST